MCTSCEKSKTGKEIESRLLKYDKVKEAVVISKTNEKGDSHLYAYLVPTPGSPDTPPELAVSQLREYLSKQLPDYMIPSFFLQINKIPMTANGKIDHKALKGPPSGVLVGQPNI